ncbi:uncharacterized protein M421DRAFT_4423 [Didymella exigua CBS 183.55]|uniref:Uncharacterized protein n=1 Tax=Didymella exigua CBS 183.55 TaxID=1150837 RepID=A0A6A5RPK6_9PLEO|nr:uncharacterized protein M421DRAFT_4423 [Didymella exigua CBS 183.55]KAF1929260.1 hypothetical protein M421DRAFT_4423 [Didymella exigua CBS 183.55]
MRSRTPNSKGLPGIAVSPSQGKYLQLQARMLKAKNIPEVGTLGGYSTIWLANAKAGVVDRVDVRLGPGAEVLPKIVEEVKQGKLDKFQLVFVGADKENNWS